MKKLLVVLLTVLMVLGLAACGGKKETASNDSLSLSIASEPATLDPALNSAVDGGTMLVHLFQGLATWKINDKGTPVIVADAIEALVDPVENEDGTATYTYTLREGLKWSDGQDVKASDYEYAWKRAAGSELGADYGYMFEVIKGYPDNLCVVADDAARTLTVTLIQAQPYWNELLAFPTFYPVRKDVVEDESWATDPATYVCNGAYTIADWTHDSVITLAKNENYIDAANVTMPTLKFYLCDDANTMLTNFKNGDWLFIDDVPTNEIATLKEEYPNEFIVSGQIGTYYVIFNVNESILPEDTALTGADAEKAEAEVRNAIALLFDRNYIVNDIAQGGQVPASSFVAMGIIDADGNEFYKNAGDKNLPGYYSVAVDAMEENFNKAVEVLKKYYTYDEASGKFTNFPAMTYLYNTSEGHKAIGEYLQSALANVGITMNMENQEWATFLETRKAGDFTIARNGWLADYTDPISFLDMWVSASGNNDAQFGKGDHAGLKMYSVDTTDLGLDLKVENGTWAETYDALVSLVKNTKDNATRFALMHKVEDLLMSTGAICPLYFYTDLYMNSSKVKGFYSTPLGFKYFMYTTVE